MRWMAGRVWGPASVVAAALAIAAGAAADPVADFYRGKTVSIIVTSQPGGGYDVLSRLIARALPQHLPGSPGVVVQNMAGAGGIVGANHLYNNAPRDGTALGAPQNNVPFEPLLGTKQANFDPTRFLWLGTPSVETAMLTVWHGVPVSSWQDAKTRELTVGASGVNSTPSYYARLLSETLGLKLKIIVGYQGQPAALVAMERGELDGYASAFYSAMKATRSDWMREPRKVKLLVQMGPEKEAEIPEVPFLPDLVGNDDDRRFVEAACAPLAIGRPYMFPPGVPAERVAAMRQALAATFRDKAFVEDATRAGLDVGKTRTGEEVAALIERIYRDTPPALVERLRRLNNP